MADHEAMITDLEKQMTAIESQIAELMKGEGGAPKRVRLSKQSDTETPEEEKSKKEEEDKMMMGKAEEAKKAEELKKADEAKKAEEVKKAEEAKNEETVTIAGQTIAKSVVGDGPFAIFKAQAEELNKAKADIAKERDLREMAELKKRADDEFKHVPGTVDERALMLKAIAPMDEKLRKSFEQVFTQAEKLSKAAFETLGTKGGKEENNGGDFEKKVADIRKRDNCSRIEALAKARAEHPEDFKAYQLKN